MAEKQKRKNVSEYQELKDSRAKDLMKQFEQFITGLRKAAANKTLYYCLNYAERNGQYDQIDEQVCLRDRVNLIENKIAEALPILTQQSMSYEQCMAECQKNSISYVVANQSCKRVFEKNFEKATTQIEQRLKAYQII